MTEPRATRLSGADVVENFWNENMEEISGLVQRYLRASPETRSR